MRKRPIILTVLLACMAPLGADNSQTQTLDAAQLVEMDLSGPVVCEGSLGRWPERLRLKDLDGSGQRQILLESSAHEKVESEEEFGDCQFHGDKQIYLCEFGMGGYVAVDLSKPQILRHQQPKMDVFFTGQYRPGWLRFKESLTCRFKNIKVVL